MRIAVTDPLRYALKVAGLPHNPALDGSWGKVITAVDLSQPGGFAFVGDWLAKEGERSMEIDSPLVVLVCGCEKDAKRYAVLVWRVTGALEPTHIKAEGKGWAYKIRENLAALLEDLENVSVELPGKFGAIEVETDDAKSWHPLGDAITAAGFKCDMCKCFSVDIKNGLC
jgi:hypothetical protein